MLTGQTSVIETLAQRLNRQGTALHHEDIVIDSPLKIRINKPKFNGKTAKLNRRC